MKVIIAGTRTLEDYALVERAVAESQFQIDEVVSGRCTGVDRLGERWAQEHVVPVSPFYVEWQRLGKSAGPARNERMGQYADALIAIWDGKSRGTGGMIRIMQRLGKQVYVLQPNRES